MVLHKIMQQRRILNDKGFKAPRLILVAMLSVGMSMGAVAGQSTLIQEFAFGHQDHEGDARGVVNPVEAVVPSVKQTRSARAIVRGMKQTARTADEVKPIVRILDSENEKEYRDLFAALKEGKLKEAETIAGDIKDGTLLGTAQALFLLHPRNPQVKWDDLATWLTYYAASPQAQDVYKKALSMRIAGDEAGLRKPLAVQSAGMAKPQKWTMIETLEWKKPQNAQVDALWRAGRFGDVLVALGDGNVADDSPQEAYYPLWMKGLAAYAVEDYATAAHSFMKVANAGKLPLVNRAAASYWAARSFEKTAQTEQASFYYEQAALNPYSYYGMLALVHKTGAHKAGYDALLDIWRVPSLTSQHIALLKQDSAGARALALLQIGEKDLALKEMQGISDKPELRESLEALSEAADVPMQVARPRNGQQARRFPVFPWRPTGGFISDPALVMAVAWNESRFDPYAQSPSGARGVMQIMPGTAERIAVGSSGSLFDAQANVTLGDLYIHKLSGMKGIDGNLLLLIAGYNCGPGRVQQLFGDAPRNSAAGKDPLLFIETMPLKETRDYVQKVMATYAAYRLRLGKPLAAMASLSRGEWPSYETVRTAAK